MKKISIVPIILSGGSGTRLWPLSRSQYPKQFIDVMSENISLFQSTVNRIRGDYFYDPIIVTNEDNKFMIADNLNSLGVKKYKIILEPKAKNTCPAVAVASLEVMFSEEDNVVLVLPSDHIISDCDLFLEEIVSGFEEAKKGKIVTFGVVPNRIETGYGYIKCNKINGISEIDSFVEKPNYETAKNYIFSGDYLWNSGMFMFKPSVFVDQLELFDRDMLENCRDSLENARRNEKFISLSFEHFDKCRSDSIDYVVMEKTTKSIVIPMYCGWSDIGSWKSIYEMSFKDELSNKCIGDVLADDSCGCYFHSTNRLIAAIGLKNIAIVETKDAVLVSSIDKSQDVKKIVDKLNLEMRMEATFHKKVFRPWGNYESIDIGLRYQVKRITVYPGRTLSLQKHYHRSEHWIVVKGTAIVTRDDMEMMIKEDQSTYIPLGSVHRLENPGKVDLEIIEVQTGSYLDEDDIVRLEDVYGRLEAS